MSVTVTIRFQADAARAAAYAQENGDFIRSIANEGKRRGAIHHRFVVSGNDLMVIDEWDSAENFQKFFQEATDIGKVMEGIGVTGAPEVTIWQPLDMKDEF